MQEPIDAEFVVIYDPRAEAETFPRKPAWTFWGDDLPKLASGLSGLAMLFAVHQFHWLSWL